MEKDRTSLRVINEKIMNFWGLSTVILLLIAIIALLAAAHTALIWILLFVLCKSFLASIATTILRLCIFINEKRKKN